MEKYLYSSHFKSLSVLFYERLQLKIAKLICKNKEQHIGEVEISHLNLLVFVFFNSINGERSKIYLFEIMDKEMSLVSWERKNEGRNSEPFILFPSAFIPFTIPKENQYIIV